MWSLSAKACDVRKRCGGGPQGTGVNRAGIRGRPSSPRPARLTRLTDAEGPGTDACTGRGSGEASGDAAVDDASRSRSADGTGFRVGDRNSATLSLREADRQLCGVGSRGELQWGSPPTRRNHSNLHLRLTTANPRNRSLVAPILTKSVVPADG
jgi:hypothetical protein